MSWTISALFNLLHVLFFIFQMQNTDESRPWSLLLFHFLLLALLPPWTPQHHLTSTDSAGRIYTFSLLHKKAVQTVSQTKGRTCVQWIAQTQKHSHSRWEAAERCVDTPSVYAAHVKYSATWMGCRRTLRTFEAYENLMCDWQRHTESFLHFCLSFSLCLSLQGNQILSGLSLDEYKATLKMIERAILATDLALYMK